MDVLCVIQLYWKQEIIFYFSALLLLVVAIPLPYLDSWMPHVNSIHDHIQRLKRSSLAYHFCGGHHPTGKKG
jgi:hypothetical protein